MFFILFEIFYDVFLLFSSPSLQFPFVFLPKSWSLFVFDSLEEDLESCKAGELESWRAGVLESRRAGELGN